MAKANIVKHNGYPAICVDGKMYPPMTATVVTCRVPLGETGRTVDKDYYKALGDSGIKIYYILCNNLEADPNGVQDFAEEASTLLSVVPDAYIMVRIVLNPSKKWMDENPDEIVKYSDNRKISTIIRTESYTFEADGMFCLCSQKWREDYGKVLLKTMDAIDALPFGDRIIGYFLGGGTNAEWFQPNPSEFFNEGVYSDLSGAFRREFQSYLDETYGKGKVRAEIPGIESRLYATELDKKTENPKRALAAHPAPVPPLNGTNRGTFLDMDTCRNTFDFYYARSLGTANSILYFAKLVKEHRPDTLTGSFYGGVSYGTVSSVSSGGVMKILKSGYVDFLANPGMYENRQPGGFTGQRQAYDSYRLHNAMFIVEDDTRTHAENAYFGELYEMFTMEDTLNVLKRDFGRNICNDLQSWWFDQHIGGGRYKFDEVYKLFARQQEIGQLAYSLDRTKENEVAFIYDEESVYVTNRNTTDDSLLTIRNYEIANIGLGTDCYLHNDLSNPDMPDYKLYVFCNCFYLTDKEREEIKKKLQKNHATALFLYGNGFINPDREKKMDASYIEELTGIKCKERMEKFTPMFKAEEGFAFTERLDKSKYYGWFDKLRKCNQASVTQHMPRSYLFPLLYAEDDKAEVLGTYMQEKLPAVVLKEADGFTSLYCGTKYISADFLREAARLAGCHIYEEDGNVLYANKNFITVHGAKSGRVTLKFKTKTSPFELYEQKRYGENVSEISFDLKKGETKMFRVGGFKTTC